MAFQDITDFLEWVVSKLKTPTSAVSSGVRFSFFVAANGPFKSTIRFKLRTKAGEWLLVREIVRVEKAFAIVRLGSTDDTEAVAVVDFDTIERCEFQKLAPGATDALVRKPAPPSRLTSLLRKLGL
jgi:hypothetical protein